jgi:outer membrane receptor protein involved in Fe transport
MEAFDIQADYTWETRFGAFAAHVMATVQPHLAQRATPDSEEVDSVGYSDGPLKWRANAGLRFSRGTWDLGWNMQHYDAYRVYTSTASATSRDNLVLGQGSAWIPTQTYHDVYGRYRFENAPGFAGGLLENAELQVSVQNILDTSPPILASASPLVAGYAREGDARLRRYSIAFTKRFGR